MPSYSYRRCTIISFGAPHGPQHLSTCQTSYRISSIHPLDIFFPLILPKLSARRIQEKKMFSIIKAVIISTQDYIYISFDTFKLLSATVTHA